MKKVYEDGVGVGAPTNNAGSGGIAGIGVGPQGEPGVSPKVQKKRYGKSRSPILFPDMMKRTMPNMVKEEQKFYAIATRTRKGHLRRVPDTKFDTEDRAKQYGDKYHRGKDGARYYAVIDHPDSKKKNLKEDTFGGAAVFEVDSHTFHNARLEKRKFKHWKTYLDEDDSLAEIREYAKNNPGKPIILQNMRSKEMMYAKYGKKR